MKMMIGARSWVRQGCHGNCEGCCSSGQSVAPSVPIRRRNHGAGTATRCCALARDWASGGTDDELLLIAQN